MKIFKIIIVSLLVVSALLTVLAPMISSYMQDYYKGQLEDFTKNTEELLQKKQFWVQIGDSPIFLCIFLGCLVAFFTMVFVIRMRKKAH